MRYVEIDIVKGIAVMCMIIFHFFYFPNQYGFKEIKYDTTFLAVLAKIAQVIFITCVGINLYLSKKTSIENKETNGEYNKKMIKRIIKIALLALCMSLFTKFIFGEKYVKFGILHFIALVSLLLFKFSDNIKIIQILFIGCILLTYLSSKNPELFNFIPKQLSFVLGFNKDYPSVDHFPILPWILLVFIGIFIGYTLKKYKIETSKSNNNISKALEKIGNKSLEIYMIHWIILYLIFCIIYSKIRKKYSII